MYKTQETSYNTMLEIFNIKTVKKPPKRTYLRVCLCDDAEVQKFHEKHVLMKECRTFIYALK